MPLENLDRAQKIQLLARLRKKLKSLVLSLDAPDAAMGAELPGGSEARNHLSVSSQAFCQFLSL